MSNHKVWTLTSCVRIATLQLAGCMVDRPRRQHPPPALARRPSSKNPQDQANQITKNHQDVMRYHEVKPVELTNDGRFALEFSGNIRNLPHKERQVTLAQAVAARKSPNLSSGRGLDSLARQKLRHGIHGPSIQSLQPSPLTRIQACWF